MADTQTVVRNMADGIITVFDGSSPANEVQVVVDEGDMAFDIVQREAVVIHDRMELHTTRIGKAKPCSGKLQVKFKEFLSTNTEHPVTPHEALFGVGAAAGWKSTDKSGSDVRKVGIRFTIVSPIAGEAAEDVIFAQCYDLKEAFSEKADADMLAISFNDFEERPTITKRTEAPNPTDEPTIGPTVEGTRRATTAAPTTAA